MIGYITGLIGVWLLCDGIFSILICERWVKANNSWMFDHSIRLIRCLIGIMLMVFGYLV